MFGIELTKTEKILATALLVAGIVVSGTYSTITLKYRQYIVASEAVSSQSQTRDVAIVLGASVYGDGRLTQILEARIVTAADLYKKGLVTDIIVTGDGSRQHYNEVEPMARRLVELGIPETHIIEDATGFDTFQSMHNLDIREGEPTAYIVTQGFHLPRALFLAHSMGIDAQGVAATGDTTLYRSLREMGAMLKAVGQVMGRMIGI